MSVATYAAAQILRVLPRVPITRAVGRLADASIPSSLSKLVVGLFTKAYDVNVEESVRPDGAFDSFDAFFTRALVPGARPECPSPSAIVSPADGRLDAAGDIAAHGEFFVKGRRYSAAELLGSDQEAARYRGGQFFIVYLSPRDYHRVHAPVGGTIRRVRSMPGDLFPVNSIGERHIRSLFSINRRVAIPIESTEHGLVTGVMVGAMIVGRITVTGIDERDVSVGTHTFDSPRSVARGDEIGVFHLGSTAVVFLEKPSPRLDAPFGSIRLGAPLHSIDEARP
jgi:phosphatidylserine decarboxylase